MKVFASIAEKGGVGKTMLATILTAGLRLKEYRVLLIGLDLQNAAPGHFLAEMPEVSGTDRFLARGVFEPVTGRLGVDVLTGGMDLDSGTLRSKYPDHLHIALQPLAERYDAVILDVPPVIQHLHKFALTAADLALVVTTGESMEAFTGLKKVMDEIELGRGKRRTPSVVIPIINRLSSRRLTMEKAIIAQVRDLYAERFPILEIPESALVASAVGKDQPELALANKNPAQTALTELVEYAEGLIREPAKEQAHGG